MRMSRCGISRATILRHIHLLRRMMMRVNWRTRLPIAGGILAVALAAGGCTKTSDNYDTRGTAGTSGTIGGTAADRGTESVMLTGCLQKGSGMNNFILTQVNTAPHTV